VSSLWTPDGEHRVPRGDPSPPPDAGSSAPSGSGEGATAGGGAAQAGTPGEAELAAVAAELLATPVEDLVANHCYGLFELAALHLSQQPPSLAAARTAIDAMGYLVDGLGDRLGRHAGSLAEGLTQLRLAFVRISDAVSAPAESRGEDGA
jgi:hypothetical protein